MNAASVIAPIFCASRKQKARPSDMTGEDIEKQMMN
jgi:hypothetical protein